MDFNAFLSLASVESLSFSIVLLFFALLSISKGLSKAKKAPPKAGGAWPLVGHLHLLAGSQPPHLVLGNMADKHGPIFTIRQGVYQAMVVSSSEAIRECFTTNDKAFSSRPKNLAAQLLGYNLAMVGFSPYGSYWREIRKLVMLEVLSNHRLKTLKHVRQSEVKVSMKAAYDMLCSESGRQKENVPITVDMKRWFSNIALNTVFRTVVGKRFVENDMIIREENEHYRKALSNFFKFVGKFVLSDAIPFLRWFDVGGHEKAMKKTAEELDKIMDNWLEEHKKTRKARRSSELSSTVDDVHPDFMDVILSISEHGGLELEGLDNYDAETVIKSTCLALILGGSHTIIATLTSTLRLLLKNPEALKKAQQELETHVGKERLAEESDLENLFYLQAIFKESMRLCPPAPLLVPRECIEDCIVGGYNIPAGTRLIVNVHKLHQDPSKWSDPLEFQPERFLGSHKGMDYRGQNFEYLPFGCGRRICPGISFAAQVMLLSLANLLHGFNLKTASNEQNDVMVEEIGDSNFTLDVILTPRLPPNLYGNVVI